MQPIKPLFQVIRRGPRPNKSVRLASNLSACPAGTAFIEASTPNKDQDDSGGCALSSGTRPFAGFITRDVITTVPTPTYSELSQGMPPSLPLETAFQAGYEASLEDADEYEAEGSDFITSSGGANDLTAATTVGTKCSFLSGKSCKATTGQVAEFEVAEIQTPVVTGNTRIRFRRIYGVTI